MKKHPSGLPEVKRAAPPMPKVKPPKSETKIDRSVEFELRARITDLAREHENTLIQLRKRETELTLLHDVIRAIGRAEGQVVGAKREAIDRALRLIA